MMTTLLTPIPGTRPITSGRTRAIVLRSFALALGAAPAPHASAQSYPDKPIRLVVPFAAGGGADYFARPLANKLSESLGQFVIVDNRGGANGAIGAEAVARATADGYTLLFGSAGVMTTGPLLDAKLKYDAERDFLPVALVAEVPFSLIAHPAVKARSVKELIALARANPGKLKYGSSGVGGAPHLAGELFNALAGTEMLHIAYRGLGPLLADLLAGRMELTFVGYNVVQQHVAIGRLVALATTGDRRSPAAPDLPTMAESGLPAFKAGSWYGVLAPARTPRAVVTRLNEDVNRAMAQQDMKERSAATGAEPMRDSPEQFAAYMRAERARWAKVIAAANIRLEP
jgi:tripartite-type tricarboxylate transporter receptor subunit TctC